MDGYEIYRSTQAGGPYLRINASVVTTTSFGDNTVVGGETYYYVVTAIAASVESVYSDETQAVVPSP